MLKIQTALKGMKWEARVFTMNLILLWRVLVYLFLEISRQCHRCVYTLSKYYVESYTLCVVLKVGAGLFSHQ